MINYDDHRQDIQKDIVRFSRLLNTSNLLRVQRFIRDTYQAQQGKRERRIVSRKERVKE